jgi:hypothetical protein
MTFHHCCLSVRGYIAGSDRDLKKLFMDERGKAVAPPQARAILMQHLAEGNEVLPFGAPCEGFDFSGGGCPGHEEDCA